MTISVWQRELPTHTHFLQLYCPTSACSLERKLVLALFFSLPNESFLLSPVSFPENLTPLLLAAPFLKISEPLSYKPHSATMVSLFLPISFDQVVNGSLYPLCHAWRQYLLWLEGEESYMEFPSVLLLLPVWLLWVNGGNWGGFTFFRKRSRASRLFVLPHTRWLSAEAELHCEVEPRIFYLFSK